MHRTYTTQGFVLSRKNHSEADRILSIFSEKFGKRSLVAKGVRYPKSKKRGSLETFSLIRYSATTSHGFDVMTEVEIVNGYSEIRTKLAKVAVAYFFLETISKITREDEPNDQIFALLSSYLSKLNKDRATKTLRNDFIYEILITLGFWPHGKVLNDADKTLEEIIERKLSSISVGKKMLL